jgi:glycosyltransferase involved in cell wall biosynthesis/peptidoglycan/xylan/chitin deacetylase (PgdA/CDA1 family)
MTQPITLVVSIDAEEDNWQPVRTGITVENIRQVPRLHRVLEGLGVRPTYFVTYQVAIQTWAAEIFRELCATGTAEVGAHLHAWNTPPLEEELFASNTMLLNLPPTLQVAKISSLTGALHAATGQRPRSFRAGRWAFGQSTAAALLECGYRVDSSVTPFQSWARYDGGPSHVGAPLDVYFLDGKGDPRLPVSQGPLVEVPVSSGYNRGSIRSWTRLHAILDRSDVRGLGIAGVASRLGLIRHVTLSPEMESVDDMLAVSQRLIDQGVRHLHVTWHSSSLSPGMTPFVATRGEAEHLYTVFATYLERLAELTPLRFATVGEAARTLLEPAAATAPPERRLVVISYHHPPDGAIGGMRWAGLTKYLRPLGWKSWIVTAAPVTAPAGRSDAVVVSCPRRTTLNDLYRRFRRRGRGAGAAVEVAGPDAWAPNGSGGLLAQLRREGALLLSLPDEGRGWVLRAAVRARKLIRLLEPDTVVSSGPPHSAHLVAWLATRGRRARWLVDFRDPWAGPVAKEWRTLAQHSVLARWPIAWLERLVVANASGVVCNTKEFAEAMNARYPRARIAYLPNGVDMQLLPGATEPVAGLGLVYVGTMYGGRDLRPVLRALRVFLDRHPQLAVDGPALRIAGALDNPASRDAFRREVAVLGLDDQVVELGVLERADALRLAARARLAVVLAQGQDLQVPAKLYELVAMGVQTFVIAAPDSAASSEARRIGASVVESTDCAAMVQIMENACFGPVTRSVRPGVSLDYRDLAVSLGSILTPGGSAADRSGSRSP